ncbi:sugar phosphate isomerase/epimerase family protein [Corynebacterium kalidii]|uniref:Sugar phosphate isomerase/epimerase n=1 Tax=Corynebacterium kalidii TaxID=2931982 RepID=A0A9X2AZ07_9CORY|nr:sugar phosphate isomerase/epimerase [Corynebacterium kalidii]
MTPPRKRPQKGPRTRPLGLAPLSALTVPPDRLVRLAAEAGFDFVGLRVLAVTDSEPVHDLSPGSALLADTLTALEETGLSVVDAEFLRIDADTGRDTWLPALEASQAVGATRFTVAAGDDDLARLTDTLGRLVQDAAAFGVVPALEPISYRSVRSLPVAAGIASATGARVLPDTLHLARFDATADELAAVADLVDMVQLCDSPARPPATLEGLVEESRARRLAPGDRDQDLAGYLRPLRDDLPVSVECPHDGELARRGAAEWIRHLHDSATHLLDSITPTPTGGQTP